ncbi:hypothetical protein IUY40_00415 [Flavobacterium sp. ALJ2]|uniref:hypothetical protein n=1 Tax=Flavobacterium sp. ALJ2 TaxID=2786960 RepID=UPI00189F93EA|nr:hypothetical protein [Flavobacterium sp. ALJ2]MBF7090008.1 hypothetical protein [Flavobacterium sp. ALJ2]
MYSKKKVFYAKRVHESYEEIVTVMDIKIDRAGKLKFLSITFSNFYTHTSNPFFSW